MFARWPGSLFSFKNAFSRNRIAIGDVGEGLWLKRSGFASEVQRQDARVAIEAPKWNEFTRPERVWRGLI